MTTSLSFHMNSSIYTPKCWTMWLFVTKFFPFYQVFKTSIFILWPHSTYLEEKLSTMTTFFWHSILTLCFHHVHQICIKHVFSVFVLMQRIALHCTLADMVPVKAVQDKCLPESDLKSKQRLQTNIFWSSLCCLTTLDSLPKCPGQSTMIDLLAIPLFMSRSVLDHIKEWTTNQSYQRCLPFSLWIVYNFEWQFTVIALRLYLGRHGSCQGKCRASGFLSSVSCFVHNLEFWQFHLHQGIVLSDTKMAVLLLLLQALPSF